MYQFSITSEERLATCHEDIQKVFNLAIKRSMVDFGIAEGHRPVKRQQKLYAQGRSEPGNVVTNVDGVNDLSKHNYKPSRAVDVYAWVNNKATWEDKYLMYLGGVITSCAKELGVQLRWGADWDSDGEIYTDHNLRDAPHYQID